MMQLTKRPKGVEFAIVVQAVREVSTAVALEPATDNLIAIMLQCVKDAADIVRDSGVQLGNDELQRLAVTLFITRSKAA